MDGHDAPRRTTAAEDELISRLKAGDEAAFAALIDLHHGALVRLARSFVPTREAAEDAAQETWMAVLTGLDRFEGRSTLKAWIFGILANQARVRLRKDARTVPFSSFTSEVDGDEPAVGPERFLAGGPWAGHWVSAPESWDEQPETRVLSAETMAVVGAAIEALPPAQRAAILMRDVHGLDAEAVCNVLGVSDTNQRVLLHRARSKVRQAVERHLEGG
ncbi:MAG: RNA polymerase sigma factor [Dehalococcoidia bacterium]